MTTQPMVGCRIPGDWKREIDRVCGKTGQRPSDFVKGAIAVALKKQMPRPTVEQRLDAIEDRLSKI